MADNSSSSPQIPQNPNPSGLSSPSPSIDLTSISSPQLPPLHPQNPSPNPNPNPNPNPSPMMTSSASSPNFQNLQRSASGSMSRLTPLQQQQLGAVVAARQLAGGGGAQMSFGQQQHGMGRIGQAAAAGQQIPVLPGQSLAQLNNMQAQMLLQPRQKASLVQGMQFNSGNTSGQGLQGMQAMGMMGTLGINQPLRTNGPLSYGQRFNGQMRQQQLSMQNALASPQKLPGQGLPRGSSLAAMNPQFSGLTQNGQSTSVNALTQQPWLKQMQQAISSPVSPSHSLQQQRQQQAFSPQQPSSSQLQHQKSLSLNPQQISQLVQQQVGSTRQHQSQQQQLFQQQHIQIQQLQLLQQLQQQHQQSPRMQGSGFQKSISLTGSQPGTPASVTTTTGGNSSQGAEGSNQLLGKRKIQDLVSQVDPLGKLDPAVEDLLLEIADDFIDTVTTFACSLAKHRKSSILESKDLLLHLEKNMHLTVPGFTKEGQKCQKEPVLQDAHNKRLESIRASMESQPFEKDTSDARSIGRQAVTDSPLTRPLKPSPSSEQLVLSAAASQMLHKVPRF